MSDVAVIFGGPSPEHDVSVLTGLQALRALTTARSSDTAPGGTGSVRALYWSTMGEWFEVDPALEAEAFLDGVPRGATRLQLVAAARGGFTHSRGRLGREQKLELDAALICCHGGPGEDGTLQAALDLAGIRYSGPSPSGAALGMDKFAFGSVMSAAGLPTLPRLLVTAEGDPHIQAPDFPGPYIVKPRFGGSSIGIDVVEDWATARHRLSSNSHLRLGAVLEPYRPELVDLQVAARAWPVLELSAIERPIRSAESADILDYRDKYVAGEGMAGAKRELPAEITPELAKELRQSAEVIAALTGLRGVARIDYLSDGRQLLVNEINTIPGSLARYLWIEPAVPFATLLADLLDEARRRPTHIYSAAGADGSVLRSAGSIAGKLS
ncbi:MAG: D-alanine--D-alanine ligase family protein [Acidimicrobiales bacterium]